ncbi:hypothetical protein AUJ84_02550 [Candidatus Pacearchaeota archaeon CG1_02_32_132]|nr:MAG: hypothetical protein AUJ84_02550 [Candidatus Pacearchaeota archaeon CG1_02_32_132]
MKENKKYIMTVNLVLLGLVMLLPGLMKLFIMRPSAVAGFLGTLGFPASTFFAWILIIAEIGSGIAILTRWKLKQIVWIPMIILVIAGLTTTISWANIGGSQWPAFLLHIALASNYWLLGSWYSKR